MLFCICYDIADNKRRRKIEKALKQYGKRVQESVFEADLDEKRYQQMKEEIKYLANHEEDNLRFYRICKACKTATETMGVGNHVIEEQKITVV